MEPGIVLRINDIITLENANTAVTEIVITTAGSSLAVTANAEHIPNIWTMTGFSFDKGLKNADFVALEIAIIIYLLIEGS
jgi:hypothetical protein